MRILGVDLARGLALIAVFVAHTAPVGPLSPLPQRWLLYADDIAAPLFTLLFGVSAGLAARAALRDGVSRARFRLFFALRAGMLIVFGLLADLIQPAVIPILHYLGAVGLVLLPVLYLRARWLLMLTIAAITVSAVAKPFAADVQLGLQLQAYRGGGWVESSAATLVGFLFTDYGYRVSGLLAFALAGLAVGRLALRGWARVSGLFVAGSVLTVAALAASSLTGVTADAYAGTGPELVKALGLACAGLAVGCALAASPLRRALAPVSTLGTVTLTFYLAHILVLAAWWHLTHLPDDSWKMVLALTLASLVGAWLIRRRWRRGPAEWLVQRVGTIPTTGRQPRRRTLVPEP